MHSGSQVGRLFHSFASFLDLYKIKANHLERCHIVFRQNHLISRLLVFHLMAGFDIISWLLLHSWPRKTFGQLHMDSLEFIMTFWTWACVVHFQHLKHHCRGGLKLCICPLTGGPLSFRTPFIHAPLQRDQSRLVQVVTFCRRSLVMNQGGNLIQS